MEKKFDQGIHLKYLDKSTSDLRGRQSVRATFKLTERSIDALSILAGQLGIKQKSLFDQLVDDGEGLRLIASKFEDFSRTRQRVAKTYVISRSTLENLERVATRYKTPRDALVEFSIEKILPLISREKEKHERRKNLLQDLRKFSRQGVELLRRAEEHLGDEDPLFLEMLKMMGHVNSCRAEVESHIARGTRIEGF